MKSGLVHAVESQILDFNHLMEDLGHKKAEVPIFVFNIPAFSGQNCHRDKGCKEIGETAVTEKAPARGSTLLHDNQSQLRI